MQAIFKIVFKNKPPVLENLLFKIILVPSGKDTSRSQYTPCLQKVLTNFAEFAVERTFSNCAVFFIHLVYA
jgi:hypothetical protein